ncbi:MAG: hypothetical protein O3B86_15070, partial [Planctomycetota bacterium]|nr:hypothetical protein [Planctomycetota bacterium]
MTIQCQCSHCGASLKVKDKLAGTEGKCPKCRKTIHIPEAFSDDSEDAVLGVEQKPARPAAPQKSAQDEEEAAIFGDDFFSTDEKPARPRYVAPVAGPDVGAAAPKEKKPRSTESETGTSIDSGSGDNAASVASSLLSKTGKRNRPDEFKDPGKPENEGYDYSEVNYLLLNRILPAVSAAVVLFSFFYWMFSGMMGSGEELPELAGVTGYVTQNGAGIAAQVMFLPKPGSGRDGTSGSSSL